jgi:hypothetical protein
LLLRRPWTGNVQQKAADELEEETAEQEEVRMSKRM